ncbi:MAG: hypothetical protein DRR16_15880 [Candidatus Parabeggiatoa sp. nov. 3]|nr:MAG: hypothetical protein DRR00_02070 [Gammaproteobacteria bacterium]RKZ58681.1 MAG: hypothetical protein DRQ99_25025 [Gammaproteobacteria bacterium]RKZ83993.1 MAG: hypothetical protein DRR16_15880 [Gammaproteobacteria bacterium]
MGVVHFKLLLLERKSAIYDGAKYRQLITDFHDFTQKFRSAKLLREVFARKNFCVKLITDN